MGKNLELIAIDADDTLWHNEHLYIDIRQRVISLLTPYQPVEVIQERLHFLEIDNIQYFGYGIKSFILSLVEGAIEISGGRIPPRDILEIVGLGKVMLDAEIRPLEHVVEALPRLSAFPLMLLTKGDLYEQETRIARSGLAGFFRYIEVVGDKNRQTYEAVLRKYSISPAGLLMVGNSLRSDILPVLELGGQAVYIPYATTWAHEHADPPEPGTPGFYTIEHLGQLPDVLTKLNWGDTTAQQKGRKSRINPCAPKRQSMTLAWQQKPWRHMKRTGSTGWRTSPPE